MPYSRRAGRPPFNSPRSLFATIARQSDRESRARLELGTYDSRAANQPGQLAVTDWFADSAPEPDALGLDFSSTSAEELDAPNNLDTLEDLRAQRDRSAMSSALATAAGSVYPSTSPRLPSPPPFPEVQLGPKSPNPGSAGRSALQDINDAPFLDGGATRRIRPGTKAVDMASGPPLIPLSELDSPFQLQEHLKALYYHHTKSDTNQTTVPITHETALIIATPPENVDRSLWLYELCRFLVQKANNLIVAFFSDSPPCSAQTCPEMRASEWQYLCAVHDPPKSCCAIDYCCHTLDWAANILTSQKHFPSRLTLGSDAAGGSQQSVRQLANIFRRVYRMFAHAWFQHRQVFWNVEANEGLYIFFKTVCDVYNLILEENYTVPPEAEGGSAEERQTGEEKGPHSDVSAGVRHSSIVEKPKEETHDHTEGSAEATTTISTGATTRRHKHTPSTGSLVTTILEGEEEESRPIPESSLPPTPHQPIHQPAPEPSKLSTSLPFRFEPGEVEEKSDGDDLRGPTHEEQHKLNDEDREEKVDTNVPEDKADAKAEPYEVTQDEAEGPEGTGKESNVVADE